jgi:hypothetical protein
LDDFSCLVASVLVTLAEGRAARRNTESLGHRDLWWQRWSWITERAVSDDAPDREWREREERARARALRWEASVSEG